MVTGKHYLLIENWFHYHIIIDLQHKYSYNLFGYNWMVAHIWKPYFYIEEANYQGSIIGRIIFNLWEKLEDIHSS